MATPTLRVIDAADIIITDFRVKLESWLQARAEAHTDAGDGVMVNVDMGFDPSSDWASITLVTNAGIVIK